MGAELRRQLAAKQRSGPSAGASSRQPSFPQNFVPPNFKFPSAQNLPPKPSVVPSFREHGGPMRPGSVPSLMGRQMRRPEMSNEQREKIRDAQRRQFTMLDGDG